MQSVRLFTSARYVPISIVRAVSTAAERLLTLKKVEIKEGESPYLLLTVYVHGNTRDGRTIIRGWPVGEHDSIFKKVKADMEKAGLCVKANGGGYINSDEGKKAIQIYGACSVHGKADHFKTREILESWSKFRGYNIEVTDGEEAPAKKE